VSEPAPVNNTHAERIFSSPILSKDVADIFRLQIAKKFGEKLDECLAGLREQQKNHEISETHVASVQAAFIHAVILLNQTLGEVGF
jgi:hypothetical protein